MVQPPQTTLFFFFSFCFALLSFSFVFLFTFLAKWPSLRECPNHLQRLEEIVQPHPKARRVVFSHPNHLFFLGFPFHFVCFFLGFLFGLLFFVSKVTFFKYYREVSWY